MMFGTSQLGTTQYGSVLSSNIQNRSYSEEFAVSEHLDKALTKTFLETFTVSENIDKARTITVLESIAISENVQEVLNTQNAVWIRISKVETDWTSLPKN